MKKKATSALGLTLLFATIALIVALSQGSIAQPLIYQEGKHYMAIEEPVKVVKGDKIEVMEVFWYGCPHCNQFSPVFEEWAKTQADDVAVEHTPAMWNKSMIAHAKIFYTAKALRLQKKMHKEVFDAMHIGKKKLQNSNQIYALFEKHGVDKDTFDKTYDSFGVKSQVQQANTRARSYGITGTPELVVNGKYRISSRTAGSQADMMKVVEYLIAKERAANKS